MKKLFISILGLAVFSAFLYADIGMIEIPSKICVANGGKMKNGYCIANWKRAGEICKAMGMKLPKFKDYVNYILRKNKQNISIDEYGMNINRHYWTSQNNPDYPNIEATVLLITYGSANKGWINQKYEVEFKCLKKSSSSL